MTATERDVLSLLLVGEPSPRIATALSLSPSTVGHVLARLRQIHGTKTTLGLVVKVLGEQRDEARRELMEALEDLAGLDRRRVRR